MNQLNVSLKHSIVTLGERGWSARRIARELGVNRETVGKYLRTVEGKPAISTSGNPAVLEAKPAISTRRCGRPSSCRGWEDRIDAGMAAGLSAQRIYQDLVREHGFEGSYQSIKRYLRPRRQGASQPVARVEVPAGREAQVDFGQGAWVLVEGRRRRPHLFRIVLSHSRKAYSEVVWNQSTENFIRCLENAFRFFGGVTQTLVIDNLRAAVTRVDWFEPQLNRKVEEFCQHYGTVILPTRPAQPQHKGKVEAGVKYVQNNALKGRCFGSLAEQNQFLSDWERSVADTRIHGTTRQQVARIFQEVERSQLLGLPPTLFPVFQEAPRSVHRDGYIELQRAYYSVPPEYIGRQVWVRWESRLVRVYNDRHEPIAIHARAEPGRFTTDPAHAQSPYRRFIQYNLDALLERSRSIGPYAGRWAQALIELRGPAGQRVLHGLLALAGKHSASAIDHAAKTAIHYGAWRLRDLRCLLEQASPPVQLDFLDTHPLIRPMEAYQALTPDCFHRPHL